VATRRRQLNVDLQGLLCALILVPRTFSRNRFFSLYEHPAANKTRRRAARVRGIIRQLLGLGRHRAEIVGEQILEDGQVLLRFRIPELAYQRTTALSPLEAAALRYALHRNGAGPLSRADRGLVHDALQRLGEQLKLPPDSLRPNLPD
jgi:hypothetical protein